MKYWAAALAFSPSLRMRIKQEDPEMGDIEQGVLPVTYSCILSRPHIFYQFIWIYSDLFDDSFSSKSLSLDMIRS
jgi:hypothetical protein